MTEADAQMKYRRLGDAGMKVSVISLGGWINYGEGKVSRDAARNVVLSAYHSGINFFDIADIYGRGRAEAQMGEILQLFPRHTLVISSKVFWPMSDDVNDRGLSRKHIMESVHKSLKRVGTDYLDIYFCHRYDPDTPLEEVCRAMDDLVHQGKILYWGTSEWTGEQIQAALDICEANGLYKPKTEQPQFSMLHRERVIDNVLPVTSNNGIGLVTWSPLAMGMLTGKYDDGIPADSRFGREDWARKRFLNDKNAAKVKEMTAIAEEVGCTRAQLALAWGLQFEGVSSVIIGATRPAQVAENIAAATVEISDDQMATLDSLLGKEGE